MIVKKQIYSKLIVCDSSGNNDIEKSNRGTGAFGSTGN
jgi:dUTPase